LRGNNQRQISVEILQGKGHWNEVGDAMFESTHPGSIKLGMTVLNDNARGGSEHNAE